MVHNQELRLGSWDELGAQALALRIEVFVTEQGVPATLEHDEDDATALHALISRDAQTLATGRLVRVGAVTGKIGRLAVKRDWRGQGLGRQVLLALSDAARAQGIKQLHLHAQCNAKPFYEREGFVAVGEPFDEAGIEHILMTMSF